MKKKITLFVFTLLYGITIAQTIKTVNITTAGTLSDLINSTEKATITNLTITGNINYTDFYTMTSMPLLDVLDLSRATINAYTEKGGDYRSFPANELPSNSFDNTVAKPSQIKLPNNLTSLGGGCFSWNTNIESITIPASVVKIGPFAFSYCSKLKRVIFLGSTPPALGSFVSRIIFDIDGNMYNDNIKIAPIIYVPVGSVNTYKNSTDMDMWKKFNIYESILAASTKDVSQISLLSATFNGTIEFIASNPIISYGFCWNITGSPTISDNKIDKGTTAVLGSFNHTITDLFPATKYYLRAYATDATGTVYGNEVTFKTASLPSAAGTVSGMQTVCQGQNSVSYTVPPITNATSYIWTLPTGATGTSSTNTISVNYSRSFTTGSIAVKGHNQWGDGVPSLLDVSANLLPADAGIITGSTTICQGGGNTSYSVPEIANATSYIWTFPSGITGTSNTNSIILNYSSNALSGNIIVKGRNNCGDGISSSLAVTVNKLPVITTTNKTLICGGSVLLNPQINYSGSGTLRYKWTPSVGLDNDTIMNPSATVTSNISYAVTVTTPNNCTATGNINVAVIAFNANAGDDKTIICGETTQLNSVTTNYTGTGNLKYKWTPATGLNNDTIASPTATVINDIDYTVTVTTPNGCTAAGNVKVKIIPMEKPQIGIVGINGSNKNMVVWNKPVNSGIDSYSVYRETNISNVFDKIGSVPYSELSVFVDDTSNPTVKSNKYKLSIVDKSGLETPLSEAHKTMHLAIYKGQNNMWNLMWEPYTGFAPTTYNIYRGSSATSLGFIDATSGSSTQFSDITAPAGDVFYQVEVISPVYISPSRINSTQQKITESGNLSTVSYNSSRSNIASNFYSGIDELKAENDKIQIFPNPARDHFRIEFEGGSSFEIQNLTGQLIYNGNLNNSNIVRTDSFKSGVYIIKFNIGKSIVYKKVIVE